jgi:hypothetical protein
MLVERMIKVMYDGNELLLRNIDAVSLYYQLKDILDPAFMGIGKTLISKCETNLPLNKYCTDLYKCGEEFRKTMPKDVQLEFDFS